MGEEQDEFAYGVNLPIQGICLGQLAVEHRPANVISEPLVIQNKLPNCLGQLLALPLALKLASTFPLAWRGSRACGLDRVGRSPEFVCGNMRHHCRLTRSICSESSASAQRSRCGVGSTTGCAGLHHLDLASHPCARVLDRSAGPQIGRLHRLEQM